jgi:hypothetical protein
MPGAMCYVARQASPAMPFLIGRMPVGANHSLA